MAKEKKIAEKPIGFASGIKAYKSPLFTGKFQKVGELVDLIPQFKEFYISQKLSNPKLRPLHLINLFNEGIHPLMFFPYYTQYKSWQVKWDKEVERALPGVAIEANQEALTLIELTQTEGIDIPMDDTLEKGTSILGGELLKDAINIFKGEDGFEAVDGKSALASKKYALNVFQHLTKHVQGNAALKLKRNAEARNNAGFLMGILAAAQAGTLKLEDLQLLKKTLPDGVSANN